MSSEWELMLVAEGIEQGDTVSVELETGHVEPMVYLSVSRGSVRLRDQRGAIHKFSASSLEEVDGASSIKGKSEETLSIRD